MKKSLLIAVTILLSWQINAQQLEQNRLETKVEFTINNFGVSVDGEFKEVQITSFFDKNYLSTSFIRAKIKVKSIYTESKKRDDHLLELDYFGESDYPEIIFQTTKIKKISENEYQLTADLTIKKTTKIIEIPIEIIENEDLITMKSEFIINRKDYNVGGKSWVLSDNVKIKVVYIANK